MSRAGKSVETESRLVFTEDRGWGMTANRYGVSFWGDKNVLEFKSGDNCTTL